MTAPDLVSPDDLDASPRHARDRILLVSTDAMRARRRPVAVGVLYAWSALAGLAAAWPVSAWVGESYGRHPRGDLVLFDPGGLALADLFARGEGLGVAVTHALVVLAVCAVLGLVPMAALVVSIGHATLDRAAPPLRAAFERAAESFGALLRLLAVVSLAQGLVVGAGLLAANGTTGALQGKLDDAAADLSGLFVLAVFVLAALFLGVVHDVARVAAIRFRVGAFAALGVARRAMRPGPMSTAWSWAWRALAGLTAAVGVGIVAHRLGGRPGASLAVLALLHQGVVLLRAALRASWLASALRLVDRA
jgi:hypothetical protein